MSEFLFKPSILVRNKHLQTIISSKKPPIIGDMVKNEQLINITVDINEVVHLNGYYSQQVNQPSKGLVILLHGWLGSDKSTYMLARGERLYQEGYDIFRLNMRDHGATTPFNKGLFHGGRLNELFQAVKQIAHFTPELPVCILGFSMGGSFALRIGWQQSIENMPIKNLRNIIAICPSVNPEQVTDAIDNSIIYRNYFCKKWKANLDEKQKKFPDIYNFNPILSLKNCRQITEAIIKEYSEYPDIDAYFSDYQFCKEKLKVVRVPMTILASADDPVIPVEGVKDLNNINPLVQLHITHYGGHVGYINTFSGNSWLDVILPNIILKSEEAYVKSSH